MDMVEKYLTKMYRANPDFVLPVHYRLGTSPLAGMSAYGAKRPIAFGDKGDLQTACP